ncbi:EF-hand domain-containing protein [Puniceicoccaceae bacterium K14]|nr:EF-hand domain-containing protein [Puniceicoccaceae bacterium K14]
MKTKLLISTVLATTLASGIAVARPGGGERPDPEQMIAQMIAEHDLDESNTLSADELQAALTAMHQKRSERREQREMKENAERPAPEEISAQLLENFDTDGDSALNSEELFQAMAEMRPGRKGGKRGGSRQDAE